MICLQEFDGKPALYNTETAECAFLPNDGYHLLNTEAGIKGAVHTTGSNIGKPVELHWAPLYAVLGTANGPN